MVIFHSHVSLPEGNQFKVQTCSNRKDPDVFHYVDPTENVIQLDSTHLHWNPDLFQLRCQGHLFICSLLTAQDIHIHVENPLQQ